MTLFPYTTLFRSFLTTVPEPASIALIGTGLVAMAVGRKKLKGNRAAA